MTEVTTNLIHQIDWCGRIPTSLKRFRWDVFKMDRREFRHEILAAELLANVSFKHDINRVQQIHVTQLPTSVVNRQKSQDALPLRHNAALAYVLHYSQQWNKVEQKKRVFGKCRAAAHTFADCNSAPVISFPFFKNCGRSNRIMYVRHA